MNRLETYGLAAALTLAGCKGCDSDKKNPHDGDVIEDTAADTGTPVDTDSGLDTDTGADTDTAVDTDTGIAEITATSKATCERLQRELPSALDDLSLTQFVSSWGAECTRDGRTFGDTMFEATLKDEVVGACVWNGEGTSADETRVIRVPATDTDPDTLSVEAEIDSSGGALVIGFYDASERLIAPDPEATNPLWTYGDEAGRCTDMSLLQQLQIQPLKGGFS